MTFTELQNDPLKVCEYWRTVFAPPEFNSKLGVALRTLDEMPVNGLRHQPKEDTSGWYIWGGKYSKDPDFFSPIHIDHVQGYCPLAIPFLALPPGYRFLTDGNYVDVWFDPEILKS